MVAVQLVTAGVVARVLTGKNLDRELAVALRQHATLTSNERQATHSIAFDVLRHHGLLSAQLDVLLAEPLTDAPVRHLLLVALAQLQFSRAPAHTVVDHAVNAATAGGFGRAKGLVNAVLRNYLRTPEKFARDRFKDPVATFDHPRWWINRVTAQYGADAPDILRAGLTRPPMHLRVNPRRSSVESYLGALAGPGMSARAVGVDGILLESPVAVGVLPHFSEGHVSVQDLGAQQAMRLLAARDGMRVLDACAAPGGKAAHLLEHHKLDLTALDSDKMRLVRVTDNLKRLGLEAKVIHADAKQTASWWDGKPFDRIMLDAPCSGSGVTRRHPDIRWIRRESDLKSFQRAQAELLGALWPCLAPGGLMLYITCSIFSDENQDVVEAFLAANANAELQALDPTVLDMAGLPSGPDGRAIALLPGETGVMHDGFYYALIRKSAPTGTAAKTRPTAGARG